MISNSPCKQSKQTRTLLRLCQPGTEGGISSEAFTGDGKIWIAIHFPDVSLEIFAATDGVPRIVIEENRGRQLVYSACDMALAQGVMSGMPFNAAHALCHGLIVHLRDPAREEQRLLIFRFRPWRRALLARLEARHP